LAPAAGRWQPEDDALASLDGGYVETNVPAVCFMNFNGSSVWTGSTGDEMAIAGSTPVEIKAEIKIDASGLGVIYHNVFYDTTIFCTNNIIFICSKI